MSDATRFFGDHNFLIVNKTAMFELVSIGGHRIEYTKHVLLTIGAAKLILWDITSLYTLLHYNVMHKCVIVFVPYAFLALFQSYKFGATLSRNGLERVSLE